MKRVFPAPWLSLALWVLWLTLNLSVSPGNLLLGAILVRRTVDDAQAAPETGAHSPAGQFCACS
jgi:hypothetical protein